MAGQTPGSTETHKQHKGKKTAGNNSKQWVAFSEKKNCFCSQHVHFPDLKSFCKSKKTDWCTQSKSLSGMLQSYELPLHPEPRLIRSQQQIFLRFPEKKQGPSRLELGTFGEIYRSFQWKLKFQLFRGLLGIQFSAKIVTRIGWKESQKLKKWMIRMLKRVLNLCQSGAIEFWRLIGEISETKCNGEMVKAFHLH